MTIERDEWDTLSAEWRAETPAQSPTASEAAERLRQRVRQHGRRQMLVLIAEILLTVYFAAFAWDAARDPSGRGIVPALVTVGMIVLVWSFVIRNRRGSWRSEGESTSDYLRLSRVRAQAGQRSVRFVRRTMIVAALCYLPWFALRWQDGVIGQTEWWRWAFLVAYGVTFWSWTVWQSRRITREIAVLDEIERELREDGRVAT